MAVAIKAMHTTSQHILPENLLSDVEICLNRSGLCWVGIMTDTQDINVVTFDFKGTGGCCFVSGCTDYQIN